MVTRRQPSREIDIALSLNPNLALAHNLRGTIHTYSGQPLEAIQVIKHGMRLDPSFSSQSLHFLGTAYLLAGNYETAAAWLRQRIILVPRTDFSRVLLASTSAGNPIGVRMSNGLPRAFRRPDCRTNRPTGLRRHTHFARQKNFRCPKRQFAASETYVRSRG